jgi:hypothetical protein
LIVVLLCRAKKPRMSAPGLVVFMVVRTSCMLVSVSFSKHK